MGLIQMSDIKLNTPTADEKLSLLNKVSGVFRACRMCALTGLSGVGKTTLVDIIAMRKTSGSMMLTRQHEQSTLIEVFILRSF